MPQVVDVYEIQPGDSLSRIATRFGVSLNELLAANQQIEHPDLIIVGQRINIPGEEPGPAAEPVSGQDASYDGHHPAPGTVSTNRSHYINPPLTNQPGERNTAVYSQLINQFAVGDNPRYRPGQGSTYCNIFVWDVSRAMGAEVAHWVDANGDIATPGKSGATEININGGISWMKNHGVPDHEWKKVTEQEAQDAANRGELAVVMWRNPTGGHGHTAVVRPGSVTEKGPTIAQAGGHDFNLGHVVDGFGLRSPLEYFAHD